MRGKMVLVGLGLVMMIVSLTALAADSRRSLDAQCAKRCNCNGSPCGAIVKCQDSWGLWTRCCDWCAI